MYLLSTQEARWQVMMAAGTSAGVHFTPLRTNIATSPIDSYSTPSGTPGDQKLSPTQQKFQARVQERFHHLTSIGLPPNEAAAQALLAVAPRPMAVLPQRAVARRQTRGRPPAE